MLMNSISRFFLVPIAIACICVPASSGQDKGKDTVRGYLVDIACTHQRSNELATIGPTHTKNCLTMPQCERSGYAVLTADQKIIRFDAAGNEKAKKLILLSKRQEDFRITVVGIIGGEQIQVSRIELRK